MALWIVIAVVALLVLVVVLLYNRLVRLRNRTENAWSHVDVQLRRRYDLIPNLVEAVKGYAAHERAELRQARHARLDRVVDDLGHRLLVGLELDVGSSYMPGTRRP